MSTTPSASSSSPPAKSATSRSVVDLVAENAELRERAKTSETRHAVNYLAIIGALAVVLIFMLWLVFEHFPLTSFIPTQNAAAICSVVPIDQPWIDDPTVVDFAKNAVVSSYSTDYANYRVTIASAAERFMLPSFHDPFITTMQNSDFLHDVVNKQFTVAATSTSGQPAVVVRKGVRDGVYTWKVQVPITFNYLSGREKHEDRLIAEVTVAQADPRKVRLNRSGIGVSWIDLKTALN
jgi:intracellular multiplication protein IcmL